MHAGSLPTRRLLFAGWLTAFTVLLITTQFALYRRAQSHLDAQMGERLRSIALSLAHVLENTPADSLAGPNVDAGVLHAFALARDENGLSNVVAVTDDGRTLVDLAGYSTAGEENPFLSLDAEAVALARAGVASPTRLYQTGGIYLKSAYAPVRRTDGTVVAIVGVEAGASFFAQLRELVRWIMVITAGTAAVVLALGLLFYRRSRALDAAEARLQQQDTLASLGRMAATIAHEIRNPLSVIRSSADRMRRRGQLDDEALGYITSEVDDLNRTLTGYLEFAQARPSEFAPVSMTRVLRRSLTAVADEASERSIVIRDELGDDVTVSGDERRLRQATLNILLNAVQAARTRVEVAMVRESGHVRVDITDDGAGIDAAILKDVTRPFFTTRARGSGLGLPVAQSVLQDHGGSLVIHSGAEGTRVRLSLPMKGGSGV